MRVDVVFIYTYIIITQYVSKNKNQKSEFLVSFFVAHFFAFYSIKYYFCPRKRSQGNENETQQSTKNHLPQARQRS